MRLIIRRSHFYVFIFTPHYLKSPSVDIIYGITNSCLDLCLFMYFNDLFVDQLECLVRMERVVNEYFLLCVQKTIAAEPVEILEVEEGDGEDDCEDEQEEVSPIKEIVVIFVNVWFCEDGVFHDVAEDDVRGETYSHVDLRVLQTEHHPAVHGLRAATEIGVLREGEECEDRKHDERGMVAEYVERGDFLVQRRHQGQEELGQVQDWEAHQDWGSWVYFLGIHQLRYSMINSILIMF